MQETSGHRLQSTKMGSKRGITSRKWPLGKSVHGGRDLRHTGGSSFEVPRASSSAVAGLIQSLQGLCLVHPSMGLASRPHLHQEWKCIPPWHVVSINPNFFRTAHLGHSFCLWIMIPLQAYKPNQPPLVPLSPMVTNPRSCLFRILPLTLQGLASKKTQIRGRNVPPTQMCRQQSQVC